MSADTSDVPSYSALTELHRFPFEAAARLCLHIGVAEAGLEN